MNSGQNCMTGKKYPATGYPFQSCYPVFPDKNGARVIYITIIILNADQYLFFNPA